MLSGNGHFGNKLQDGTAPHDHEGGARNTHRWISTKEQRLLHAANARLDAEERTGVQRPANIMRESSRPELPRPTTPQHSTAQPTSHPAEFQVQPTSHRHTRRVDGGEW